MKQRDDWHLTDSVSHEQGRGDPFAAAIRGTRMSMIITDPRKADHPIVFANGAFERLTGYGHDEIIGRNCRFLQGPETDAAAVEHIRTALAAEEAASVDILNYRKDGSTFWNALYISPVRGDDDSVQFYFGSQIDITERIEAHRRIAEDKAHIEREVALRTSELQAALDAKTTLLHEVDHRVKNNLTMIGSLLRLQSRTLGDPKLQRTLETMLERIDALSTVHRRLYQSDDVTRFDIGTFAKSLAVDVLGSAGRQDITLVTDIDPIQIPASKAAATGLILNELITNAVKHAYADGRSGQLELSVKQINGAVTITLRDDGTGFDPGSAGPESIGQSLVQRLSRQIKATTEWQTAPTGTYVSIIFPADIG